MHIVIRGMGKNDCLQFSEHKWARSYLLMYASRDK